MPNKKTNPNATTDLPAAIGKPAGRALAGISIARLTDLTRHTEAEMLALHGVGPKAVRILKEELKARCLSFRKST